MGDDFPGNFYPNPDNYPETSFPQEVSAPLENPADPPFITVKYNPDWTKVLMAAVDQLLNYSTWEGTDAEKVVAVQKANELKSQLQKDQPYMIRLNPLNCNLEQSQDGGESWSTVPGWEFIGVCVAAAVEEDFVNVPGDTMTGTLISDLPDAGSQQHYFMKRDGGEIGRFTSDASGMNFYVPSGQIWRFATLGADQALLQGQANRVTIRAGDGVPVSQGAIRLRGNDLQALLAGRVDGVNHYEGYDVDNILRCAMSEVGGYLGSVFEGYDWSTTTWRRQFALEGLWDEDTDASRQGGFKLSVEDYAGSIEIMRSVFKPSESLPSLSIFEGDGNRPTTINYNDPLSLAQGIANSLTDYGFLLGINDLETPVQDEELTAWECCNAAYFIAEQMATDITDTLSGISGGDPFIDLFDALLGPPFDYIGHQVAEFLNGLFDEYGSASAIASDLADVSELAADICANGFELAGILSDVSGYSWDAATISVVSNALIALWGEPTVLQSVVDYGKYQVNSACDYNELDCTDRTYDFRWSGTQGWELFEGTYEFSVGLKNELNDGDYSVRARAYLPSCTVLNIYIDYYCPDAAAQAQLLQVWRDEDDGMGGYDRDPIPYQTTMSVGHNTWSLEGLSAETWDRLVIRLEEEPVLYGNYIKTCRLEFA